LRAEPPGTAVPQRSANSVGRALQEWWPSQQRLLPWRTIHDRYPLVVAEILLQQTAAADAAPVWARLITRYSSAADLANADASELRDMVAALGLGTQRSQRLISAAIAIEGGSERIPGVGEYGSGVVALAVGDLAGPVPVDTNIARIVTRVWGLRFDRGETRKKRVVIDLTASILDTATIATSRLSLLYALVDFGALVCKSTSPLCGACPLSEGCSWVPTASETSRTRAISAASARPSGGGTASDTSRI